MYSEDIKKQIKIDLDAFFEQTDMKPGSLFVLGCSTSEILGEWMGSDSSQSMGDMVISTILPILKSHNVDLAVQGCQHINRALLIERSVAIKKNYEVVTVFPSLHAGGAAQVAAFHAFKDPVEVEHIVAEGGMDIGDTQIGMHVKFVQIPIKTPLTEIGKAHTTFLNSRPKLIGGGRALYDASQMDTINNNLSSIPL